MLWFIKYGTKPYLKQAVTTTDDCAADARPIPLAFLYLYIMLCTDRNAFQIRVALSHSVAAAAPAPAVQVNTTHTSFNAAVLYCVTTLAHCTI